MALQHHSRLSCNHWKLPKNLHYRLVSLIALCLMLSFHLLLWQRNISIYISIRTPLCHWLFKVNGNRWIEGLRLHRDLLILNPTTSSNYSYLKVQGSELSQCRSPFCHRGLYPVNSDSDNNGKIAISPFPSHNN